MYAFIISFGDFFNNAGGQAVSAAVALIVVVAMAGIYYKKTSSVKIMTYTAACLALATVLSVFKGPSLPAGGSITLCSMLFVTLIGYFFGPAAGIIGGITYGFIQLAIGPYVVHPVQLFLDYPLAFGALGISGFFNKRKYGLYIGYIAGALLRLIIHIISGVIFFAADAGGKNVIIYSIVYNMTYIIPEMILTCALISIPALRRAINQIKQQALIK